MAIFEVYTDGSCKRRWGSWAYLVLQEGIVTSEASARARKTNSNRMEFQAAIESLKSVAPGSTVTLHTDCRILLENIPQLPDWAAQGWLKKNTRPIPNADLWAQLLQLVSVRTVTWKWVKAHSGNIWNERCDLLCQNARAGGHS